MNLPAYRLADLRDATAREGLTAGLRALLLSEVLLLPAQLPAFEREAIAELLATCLDLPVRPIASLEALAALKAEKVDLANHLIVVLAPAPKEPARVPDAVLLAVRAALPGQRRLNLPQEVRSIRNLVLDAIGRSAPSPEIRRLAAWAGPSTDSPEAAIRFIAGALAHLLARPEATPEALYAEGLAAVIAWHLQGLDPRVVQWVLAHAAQPPPEDTRRLLPEPRRLVGTEAAILGREAALLRAFEAGLVHLLPDDAKGPLDLRRPLEILGRLDGAPIEVTLLAVARALRPYLDPESALLLDRLTAPPPPPLGIGGPVRRRPLIGRSLDLERLLAAFEPAREIRSAVVYGVEGIGKHHLAAAVSAAIGSRLETIGLSFVSGPAIGWQRIANALRVEVDADPEGRALTPEGIPRWVRRTHDRLRERPFLLVVDSVDEVPEEDLPRWLPSGEGTGAVLVLSRTSQRALQRDHDAITVALRALGHAEAQRLLAAWAPAHAKAIDQGEAEALLRRLDGHPGAIVQAATLLEKMSFAEALAEVGSKADPVRGALETALASLGEKERDVIRALAGCAPEGSPEALPLRMAGVGPEALERLGERAIVRTSGGVVQLLGFVRLVVEGMLGEDRNKLEFDHATFAAEMLRGAQEDENIGAEDAIYRDSLLALARLRERCLRGEAAVAPVLRRMAISLRSYPRGSPGERLEEVIAAFRVLLTIWTRETTPEDWARTQNSLGIAFCSLPIGDLRENHRKAIEAQRAALTVYTKQRFPQEWARTQDLLGSGLSRSPSPEGEAHLLQAIEAYRSALTVFTQTDFPHDWARVQNNLANSLADLRSDEPAENLQQAIKAYQAAAAILTEETDPHAWAQIQHNLGLALTQLPASDPSENLRQALDAYRAALRVRTKEVFPRDWAQTQCNLAYALATLPSGDRADNLRQVIDAYRAALTVFTEAEYPHHWKGTRAALDASLQAFEALRPPPDLP